MKKPDEKLRVIMMAPTRVPGGITTWLRILLKYTNAQRVQYRVIDTSKMFDPLGKDLGVVGALLGVRDAVVRLIVLLWTISKFRPHVVYFTCAPSIGFVVRQCTYLFILRVMGVPTVIHLRGGKVEKFFGGGFVRRGVACAGASSARAVLVITRDVEEAAVGVVGRQKVFYIPNMIDDEALAAMPPREIPGASSSRPTQLLHVAWQAPAKGSLDLVEALGHVQSPVDCNLVGVCAEENRERIEGRIARLDLGRSVRLAGLKAGRELAEYYERADLFVFPTHSEGFPNAVLEAMGYGLPVLSTDVGNIREMLGVDTPDPAGIVLDKVNPVDPEELARKIDALIASPDLRRAMSRSGMRRARALYSATKVVPELEGLVDRIASKTTPAPRKGRPAIAPPRRGRVKDPAEKLRVILLAPTRVTGGITTWLRVLLTATDPARVEYRVIDTSRMFHPLGKKLSIRGSFLGLRDAVVRLLRLLWTVGTVRPHLIYFTCAPSIGFVARDCPYLMLLRLLRVPTVIHLHGGKVEGFFGGGVLRRWAARTGARCSRAILAITRPVEQAAVELVGRRKVFYVPNMIEDAALAAMPPRRTNASPASGKTQLLHVAWQAPDKGSLDLIEALSHVHSPVDCSLVGVCAEENRRTIDGLISRLGLAQTVRLAGLKKGRDLAEYFEKADLFVFPSHFEGFPMAVLEAMAYGLPVLATDVGNIREMIGADTDAPAGVVLDRVNPIDPLELARRIDELVASPALRQAMGRNGMRRARALYPAGKVVPELEELLERIAREDEDGQP